MHWTSPTLPPSPPPLPPLPLPPPDQNSLGYIFFVPSVGVLPGVQGARVLAVCRNVACTFRDDRSIMLVQHEFGLFDITTDCCKTIFERKKFELYDFFLHITKPYTKYKADFIHACVSLS